MTQFIGGPYDGEDLPIDPKAIRIINLPPREQISELFFDPQGTGDVDWPHRYKLDATVDPPVFRFVE